jgi:hypothetical protein
MTMPSQYLEQTAPMLRQAYRKLHGEIPIEEEDLVA